MSVIILISQFSIKVLISLRSQDNPNLRKKMAFLITSRCPPLHIIYLYESIYSTPSKKHNKVLEKCTEIFRPRIFNLRHKIHLKKKKPEKLTTRWAISIFLNLSQKGRIFRFSNFHCLISIIHDDWNIWFIF